MKNKSNGRKESVPTYSLVKSSRQKFGEQKSEWDPGGSPACLLPILTGGKVEGVKRE